MIFWHHLLEVIDGDTVRRPDGRGGMEEFRLLGFDAPETHGKAKGPLELERGLQAAARLRDLLDRAWWVRLCPATAENGNKMSWNRRFAHLYIDGRSVAEIAITEGWGAEYHGGAKPSWNDPDFNFQVGLR
jgi:endonuclease YncB( thermonuclease family)